MTGKVDTCLLMHSFNRSLTLKGSSIVLRFGKHTETWAYFGKSASVGLIGCVTTVSHLSVLTSAEW